jgi:hypothetical protein
VIGGTNDPGLCGSAISQVIAQAASDLAGAAKDQIADLVTACKTLATALGVSATQQSQADGKTEAREKANAWCALAVQSMGTSKAKAGGAMQVQFAPEGCKLSVTDKGTCQGRCQGSPCDTTANPMICSGGQLSNDDCTGGKLEGGCAVDAKCDASCDATVTAKATCGAPVVTIESSGASDAAEAAKLKAALESNLPTLIALKDHCEIEASLAASFSGNVSSVADIKPACIPTLVSATANALNDIQVCASSTTSIAGSVGQ